MPRQSLKTHCLNYIKERYPEAVQGGVMEQLAHGYGYSASNGLRRCRELAREGLVEAIYYKGYHGEWLVSYKYILPTEENAREKAQRELAQIQGRRKLEKVWNGTDWVMKEIISPIS